MPLTDSKIRNAKPGSKPYKLTDSNGLYLDVRPSGAKFWRYRYRIAGKENIFTLGEYAQAPRGETKEQAKTRCDAGMLTEPISSDIADANNSSNASSMVGLQFIGLRFFICSIFTNFNYNFF